MENVGEYVAINHPLVPVNQGSESILVLGTRCKLSTTSVDFEQEDIIGAVK